MVLGACRMEYAVAVENSTSEGSPSPTLGGETSTDAAASLGTSDSPATSQSGSEGSTATPMPNTESEASAGALDSTSAPPLDDTGPRPECEAPKGHTVCDEGTDVFQTIGLGCPSVGDDHTPVISPAFVSADPRASSSVRIYGNEIFSAREGSRLLVLTTGVLPEPDGEDRIDVPFGQTRLPPDAGNNGNPDDQTLPLPIRPVSGSHSAPFVDCDGHGDCSETLPAAFDRAHDLLYLSFSVEVPNGTFGYQVDLAWFSAEFPRLVDEPGNDLFVWWQSSDAFTGNVTTFGGAPMSATGLQPYITDPSTQAATGNVTALVDTGYEGSISGRCTFSWGTYSDCPNGATTGWMTLEAPVQPGETVQIVVALFDQGDANLDTTVLLDNWRWSCGGCDPATTCGLRPL